MKVLVIERYYLLQQCNIVVVVFYKASFFSRDKGYGRLAAKKRSPKKQKGGKAWWQIGYFLQVLQDDDNTSNIEDNI